MSEPSAALARWSWQEAVALLVPPRPALDSRSAATLPEILDRLEQAQVQLIAEPAPDDAMLSLELLSAGHQLCCRSFDAGERKLLRRRADQARRAAVGETVTFVVNRNLNLTNHCVKHCSFCAFRRDPGSPGAYWLSLEELQRRAAEAQAAGATELCIQSGLNPEARLDGSALAFAVRLLSGLLEAAPGIHLHAFSPQELLFIAEQDGVPLRHVLLSLLEAGLGSVPGTAAEVLCESLRQRLCPEKLSARAWVAVILEVHDLGIASTSTLLAGHLETLAERAAHLLSLVAIQRRALRHGHPGFSEFVLLPFVGANAPASLRQRVGRDQPNLEAMLVLTAQARLVLGPWLRHHQPSWVKLTLEGAAQALRWGCDDLGGTLMEEHISTMAGARGGTSQTPASLIAAAQRHGRPVRQRTTLYEAVEQAVL